MEKSKIFITGTVTSEGDINPLLTSIYQKMENIDLKVTGERGETGTIEDLHVVSITSGKIETAIEVMLQKERIFTGDVIELTSEGSINNGVPLIDEIGKIRRTIQFLRELKDNGYQP